MSLEEYIANNFSEEQLNEYSHYSGWHDTILDLVKSTWIAATENAEARIKNPVTKGGEIRKMNKINLFLLGFFIGGIAGIAIHAYVTGTLFA